MNPRILEPALDKLRPGWRERQRRKKSAWNLAGALLGLALVLVLWYLLFQGAWWIHVQLFPDHASMKSQFWGEGISGRAFASSFLLLMPLGGVAMIIGFLLANLLLWVIPPARRVMEAEAAGDREMTFVGANAGLIKWGGIIAIICTVASLVGVATLSSLR